MVNEQGELLELAPIIRREIERARAEERENRSAWQRVKREFEERLNGFDYIEKTEFYVVGKTRGSCEREIRYSWKVTRALSTLLRAVYRVENIAKIPAEKEPEVREFVDRVLKLMEEGGREMNISMKTPFGEMSFDVTPEQVTDLMQRAFEYAAEKSAPPAAIPATDTAPAKQEDTPPPTTPKKPLSRVERMFGDFKSKPEPTDLSEAPPETKAQIIQNAERLNEKFNENGYTGFLLLECPHCGKVRGFCTKKPITEYVCSCGGRSEIKDLLPAFMRCKCGKRFKYQTNIVAQRFDYSCLECGSPIDLELNGHGTAYVTME